MHLVLLLVGLFNKKVKVVLDFVEITYVCGIGMAA